MQVTSLLCGAHVKWSGALQGVMWFYSMAVKVKSFSCAFLPFDCAWQFLAPCPPSLFMVSMRYVPLFFIVTVPGGCRSQGCHGYPTCSALVLVAPPFFQHLLQVHLLLMSLKVKNQTFSAPGTFRGQNIGCFKFPVINDLLPSIIDWSL